MKKYEIIFNGSCDCGVQIITQGIKDTDKYTIIKPGKCHICKKDIIIKTVEKNIIDNDKIILSEIIKTIKA